MSHLMTNGKPCGKKDGHKGKHRSPESVEQQRELMRKRYWTDPEAHLQKNREYHAVNRDVLLPKQREYWRENRDVLLTKQRDYYAANKDTLNAKRRTDYQDNRNGMRDKARQYGRNYHEANRDECNRQSREYYLANRDAQIEYRRAYRAERLDEVRARDRAYHWANRDERLERMRAYTRAVHDEAIAVYGDICACCGTDNFLQIDHVYGAGSKHVREMFNGNTNAFYLWLIDNEPMGFQILCGPCNYSKHGGDSCQIDHSLEARVS